jgi:hypothetical protein
MEQMEAHFADKLVSLELQIKANFDKVILP